MQASFVVVKRSRRDLFAAPRAIPHWFRTLWSALFPSGLEDAVAAQAADQPHFPELVYSDRGEHRCVACDRCVEVCPSRCLVVTSEGAGTDLCVTGFDLDRGACIGCGLCLEACPESALKMTPSATVEPGSAGRRPHANLLAMQG